MLDATDPNTHFAIKELCDVASAHSKPIVFWIGAGASRWCGIPSWGSLAEELNTLFRRRAHLFDKNAAGRALGDGDFPQVFQKCHEADSELFNRELVTRLALPARLAPVFKRFIAELSSIQPLRIITTNVDELLERNLPSVPLIAASDLGRAADCLANGGSFIAKVHGSISSINDIVFTKSQYERLYRDRTFLESLKRIFATSSVIFLGYGLGDEYVVQLLRYANELAGLFGNGPHFHITKEASSTLPVSIRRIKYKNSIFDDHREPVRVLAEVRNACNVRRNMFHATTPETPIQLRSAHLLADIVPPGTYNTSNAFQIRRQDSEHEYFCVTGHGLTRAELYSTESTAFHDLIVGLICFDTQYAHIGSLGGLNVLVGDQIETLISERCLRFIDVPSNDMIRFPDLTTVTGGTLETMSLRRREANEPENIHDRIRRILHATPGNEVAAERQFDAIASVTDGSNSVENDKTKDIVRGLALFPSIRKALSMSEGVAIDSIPKWYMYPVLRLARVVRIAVAVREMNLASTKLELAHAGLVGKVFETTFGNEWCDSIASYVIGGSFNLNVGAYVSENPAVLRNILQFRDTEAGISLRRSILAQIQANDDTEFLSSVNAGLAATIPSSILESAHHAMAQVLINQNQHRITLPALWGQAANMQSALSLWKQRSAEMLRESCSRLGVARNSLCPCGSGDKLRECCGLALGTC